MNKDASKAYYTITEVSKNLNLPSHVMRFWETKFSQLKPMKRSGGRRYYQRKDIEILEHIKELLYNKGFTIKGAQKLIGTKSNINDEKNQKLYPLNNDDIDKIKVVYSKLSQIEEKIDNILKST